MPDRDSLPKYRHYKPKNLGVVRINGRDIYLGRYNSPESLEKYGRVIAEWRASGLTPSPEPTADDPLFSINEVILAFWKHAELHYRHPDGTPTGEARNFRDSLHPLRKLYGSTVAQEFSPKGLKRVRQTMIDSGLCRNIINQRIGRVVHVFKWAASEELIPVTVYQALKTVPGLQRGRTVARETEPVEPVPDLHVDAIRPFVSRQVWAMIELQRLTGMRPGELVIMRTGDIDRSGDVWVYAPRQHKTEWHGHLRSIYIGPRAQSVLSPWLRADPDFCVFSPSEARAERLAAMRAKRKSKVQPSQRNRCKPGAKRRPGSRFTVRTYYHAISAACALANPHPDLSPLKREALGQEARARLKALDKAIRAKDATPEQRAEFKAARKRLLRRNLTSEQRAELKAWHRAHRWHPHQLRHNAATRLRKEFGLDVARVILGHSSLAVTEVYAELDKETALSVMERVG